MEIMIGRARIRARSLIIENMAQIALNEAVLVLSWVAE
jgi:hypothetical protein